MTLKTHCKPRQSVFDRNLRDIVLDLSDFLKGKIEGDKFFEENFITSGMKTLFEKTFARLENRGDQVSSFLLTQSMGGGKTHNMIALGLLAKNPALREKVLGKGGYGSKVGDVRVIGFEENAPAGLDYLKTDGSVDYWGKRKAILALLAYFKPVAHIGHMPHCAEDADAAERLAGAVENDH